MLTAGNLKPFVPIHHGNWKVFFLVVGMIAWFAVGASFTWPFGQSHVHMLWWVPFSFVLTYTVSKTFLTQDGASYPGAWFTSWWERNVRGKHYLILYKEQSGGEVKDIVRAGRHTAYYYEKGKMAYVMGCFPLGGQSSRRRAYLSFGERSRVTEGLNTLWHVELLPLSTNTPANEALQVAITDNHGNRLVLPLYDVLDLVEKAVHERETSPMTIAEVFRSYRNATLEQGHPYIP